MNTNRGEIMKRIISFIIIIGFTVFLSSCLKISKFEDNFIDAGYTYSEDTSYLAEGLLFEFEQEGIEVSIYAFNTPGKVAIIIDFDDKDDIDKSLENNAVLQNLISKFNIESITRKNFLVIPITATEEDDQEIIDIFQD
jgi:hypothetical protein